MRGGQNKKSKGEKKLLGTYRKDRDQVAAQTSAAPPEIVGEPPKSFTAEQRRSWAELAPAVAGVYAASDRPTFCLLCKMHALLETRAIKLAPYVEAGLMRQVAALLEAFGCSPRSRRTVAPPEPAPLPDSLDEFILQGETPLIGRGLTRGEQPKH